MTHDEVIAWIDLKIKHNAEYQPDFCASLLANRDVLERHKPIPYNDGSTFCRACNGVPCPTYQDIYNRISEVM